MAASDTSEGLSLRHGSRGQVLIPVRSGPVGRNCCQAGTPSTSTSAVRCIIASFGGLEVDYLLYRAAEQRRTPFEPNRQIAAGEVHEDVAPVRVRRGGDGDRARAGRERLPHAALPDPRRHLARCVHASELDVRSTRETRVGLEQRADQQQVAWVAGDDRVGVPDGDRHDFDPIDPLRRENANLADLLFDSPVRKQARDHGAVADPNPHSIGAGFVAQPARRDPCSVPRHLRRRSVGIPDEDPGGVLLYVNDFEDPVRLTYVRANELGRERDALAEEVCVSGCTPLRESHPQRRPAVGRHAP
jgi:hypothetical protein